MLKLHNLSLTRGTRVLYSGATVAASSGERIGLVGENGSGKSTLFAAVLQEITSEAGDIESPALSRIAQPPTKRRSTTYFPATRRSWKPKGRLPH
jgi:ATP-binding cassette subfamily F protein 3